MTGIFKSCDGRTVVTDTETFELPDDAPITLDRRRATLAELQPGDQLEWAGDPVAQIVATRPVKTP